MFPRLGGGHTGDKQPGTYLCPALKSHLRERVFKSKNGSLKKKKIRPKGSGVQKRIHCHIRGCSQRTRQSQRQIPCRPREQNVPSQRTFTSSFSQCCRLPLTPLTQKSKAKARGGRRSRAREVDYDLLSHPRPLAVVVN